MKRRSVWIIEYRTRGSHDRWACESISWHSAKEARNKAAEQNRHWPTIVHRVVRYDASK